LYCSALLSTITNICEATELCSPVVFFGYLSGLSTG